MTPARFAALHARAFTDQRPWAPDEFAALMDSPFVFALGDDTCAALGRVVADEAELLTLATDPAFRRAGRAAACLIAYEDAARGRGALSSILEVAVTNIPAIALYQAAGYEIAGCRRGYALLADGRRVDAHVMKKLLS